MRIKRFTAPDMRTALRLVREEQGPDAVILSNRQTAEGVEVVAATDYDEALVHQALRTVAAPTAAAPAPAPAAPALVVPEPATPMGRAVFQIGDAPAPAAELPAPMAPRPLPTTAHDVTPTPETATTRPPSRLEQMMAVLAPARATRIAPPQAAPVRESRIDLRIDDDLDTTPVVASMPAAVRIDAAAAAPRPAIPAENVEAPAMATAAAASTPPPAAGAGTPTPSFAAHLQALQVPTATSFVDEFADLPAPAPLAPAPAAVVAAPEPAQVPALRVVEPDPAVSALHAELAAMRQVIEQQLGQFAVERLRGSPGRAAAMDALLACGCDQALAQDIAARLDATLPADAIQAPLQAELARLLPVMREEPTDEGGVIALLGPTGAGKTTTIAKLAARFAQRHRARDVALVTTDTERTGAREQLHALGRRLGITVCDADGPDGLSRALEQLVDYPLVLVDTAGYGLRDRALLRQILWVRAASRVRSLLVLPANAHPNDLSELLRRYRPAAPEGVVLTKLDESVSLGAALSVLVQHGLPIAYTTAGQCVPDDLEPADAQRLAQALDLPRTAADPHSATEDRHAFA